MAGEENIWCNGPNPHFNSAVCEHGKPGGHYVRQTVSAAEYAALEAQLTAANDLLCRIATDPSRSEPFPGWVVYIGDEAATCAFCETYGGNPYDGEEVWRDWPHEADCLIRAATKMLWPVS